MMCTGVIEVAVYVCIFTLTTVRASGEKQATAATAVTAAAVTEITAAAARVTITCGELTFRA